MTARPFDNLFAKFDRLIQLLDFKGETMHPESHIVGPDELYAEFMRLQKTGELKGASATAALKALDISIQFTIAKQLSRIADSLEANLNKETK